MNDFTVYMHVNKTNCKRYIGITHHDDLNKRWVNGKGYFRNKHFNDAIKKYGWDNFEHIVLYTGLSKSEAEAKEITLIEEHNSVNPQKGYNIENGGACPGTHSEETKAKISAAQRGEKNHAYGKPSPTRGKKASPETIEKNRQAHLGQPAWNKGKRLSEEQRRNMGRYVRTSETRKKMSDCFSRRVLCVETGVIYPSCKEAGIDIGVNRGSISNVALGKRKRAGGYHWKYV